MPQALGQGARSDDLQLYLDIAALRHSSTIRTLSHHRLGGRKPLVFYMCTILKCTARTSQIASNGVGTTARY